MDIIVCVLLGAMCGMGVGSAGLFVTYLVIFAGMEQIKAQGTNLAFFLCAGLCSLPIHLKKRSLSLGRIARIAIPAAVFSVIGSLISPYIPGERLRSMFGILLCAAGINSALRCVRVAVKNHKNKKLQKNEKTLDKP